MPEFKITGPDGKAYRVTGDNPAGAMAALKSMLDSGTGGETVDPRAKYAQGQTHPELDTSNIPGFDPNDGLVHRPQSQTDSFLGGASDMMTLGFGDEAASAMLHLFTDTPYEKWMASARRLQEEDQAQNPNSYLAGQIAGGLGTAVAGGAAGIVPNASSLFGKVVAGAATGAAMGGIHGVGSGEGLEDRLSQGLKEGAIGFGIGGALPAVGAGLSTGYRKIADALGANRAAKAAGYDPAVVRTVNDAMQSDMPVARQNILAAGKDGMLADAGPNAQSILDTAIQRAGPATTLARTRLADRTATASDDLTAALDASLGVPEGVTAARTAIRTGSAGARGDAYDAAYAKAIDYASPEGMALEQIVKGRVPQSAIKAANELMRVEGHQSRQILAKVGDDGSIVFERLPDVRQLDYLTRGLREVADQADGAGKLGGTTATGRAYGNLAQEIRQKVRGLVPEYGTALDTAADPIRRSQAVEFGARLLSPSVQRDQVQDFLAGMSAAERAAVSQGVRSNIDDMMANVRRTVQDGDTGAREAIAAIKSLSSRAGREKLSMLLGQGADGLLDEVDRIARSFDLRASVATNSKTFARQATDRHVTDMTEPGIMRTFGMGRPLEGLKKIAQAVTESRASDMTRRQNAVYEKIAEALTRPNGAQVLDTFNQIGQSSAASKLIQERIARALNPTLAYPSTLLLQGQAAR